MAHQQKVQALVLSRRKVGEADRLVSFFTRQDGLVRAVAKGVRKIPSSRGAHLEPFTKTLVVTNTSPAGTYISGAETQEYFFDINTDDAAFEHAKHITSLLVTLFGEDDPHPHMYDLLEYSWRQLPQLSQAKQNQLESAVTVMMLAEAGVLPSWQMCEVCRNATPNDAVVLDPTGGWRCITCHASLAGTRWSLSPRLFKVLRYVSTRPEHALRVAITESESMQLLMSLRYFTNGLLQHVGSKV